jgi:thiamine phosphate synthase YjbQ (UPF0047 family)
MAIAPTEIKLEFNPSSRLDVIDVRRRLPRPARERLRAYRKALYCSYHTTAGYLEQSLCSRFDNRRDTLHSFFRAFQRLFPPNADYQHDALHLRAELTDVERRCEPRNADSHLTFIGSGLKNCVTYANRRPAPVYFIDLDGIHGGLRRHRRTSVIGYNDETVAQRTQLTIPVSGHAIDSVNLWDARLGFLEWLNREVERVEIEKGRIDITLDSTERHAGLTVNEYETLLMKHDLAEVLRNPLQFMAEKGRHLIQDPRAIPGKVINYAKYDLVQVLNETFDALGMSESLVERILDKFLAVPAARRLRMKRSVSLAVTNEESNGRSAILRGKYQSPILVQWKKAEQRARRVNVTFVRFV